MTDINKDGLEVSSNGIIFNLKFHKNYSSDYTPKSKNDNKRFTNSKWYRSSQSVSYFLRDSACDKTSKDEAKLFNSLTNFTNLPKDDIINISNNNDVDDVKTNGFSSLGDLTKDKILELEKKLTATDSIIWSSVISFTPEYSSLFCDNKQCAKALIENIKTSFFKSAGLNPDNMEWYASFHNNTPEHPHIHFLFFEKDPLNIDSKGNYKYSNGFLPKSALVKTIGKIYEFHHKQNHDYFNLRDEIRNEIKSSRKENYFETILRRLSNQLKDVKSYQYANISNENKILVNGAFKEIMQNNKSIKNKYELYIEKLYKEQNELQKIWLMNHKNSSLKNLPPKFRIFAENRVNELYNRCGNTILNYVKLWNTNKKTRKHYLKKNAFSSHNNCKYANYTRKGNSKLARQLKNSLIGLLQQNQDEAMNQLENMAMKEYYKKLMQEENQDQLSSEESKINHSHTLDSD